MSLFRLCSWCGRELDGLPVPPGSLAITHTICSTCEDTMSFPTTEKEYRGFRLTMWEEEDGPVWYVHHPSEAADFGASSTLAGAERLVDSLIERGAVPALRS